MQRRGRKSKRHSHTQKNLMTIIYYFCIHKSNHIFLHFIMEEGNNVDGIFANLFFTSFLLATVSTFSQIPTHTYTPFNASFRVHLLLEALLASPSGGNHCSPPHLRKQLVPPHITLENFVLGLVKLVLGTVLSLPQTGSPAQPRATRIPVWTTFPLSAGK